MIEQQAHTGSNPPPPGLDASANLVVAATADGGSRCTVNRSAPPLTFRSTPANDGGCRLTSVGTAAGPVGGDRLRLDIEVGPSAMLTVDSAGAMLVMPGPRGERSSLTTRASIGDGSTLRYAPEPTVLVAGCQHGATTRICIGGGARLVWTEALVLGRHDEPSGAGHFRLLVDRSVDGQTIPLLRTGLNIGGIGWQGGAVVDTDTRLVAQTLLVGVPPGDVVPPEGTQAATTRLAEDAWLATVVAATVEHARDYLATFVTI